MGEDVGDGIEELIENELCLDEDGEETGENEDNGMVVDILGNEEDEAVDKSDNEDEDEES